MTDEGNQPADERPGSPSWLTSATILGPLVGGPADNPAWARFDAKYRPLIVKVYQKRGHQDADVADLAQDALLRLAKDLPTFEYDPQRKFRHFVLWVLKIVEANFWRDRGRRPADHAARGGDPEGDDAAGWQDATAPADAIAEGLERDHLVGQAVDRVLSGEGFTPLEAEAVRQLTFAGRKAPAIAADLGIEQARIYRAGYRFEKRLREDILAHHPEFEAG